MKFLNKLLLFVKFVLLLIILIYSFYSVTEVENITLAFIALLAIILLIFEFIVVFFKSKTKKKFVIDTEFGVIKISENVIEHIISITLRKYKIIKHYICTVYNRNNQLVINLNVETSLKRDDILPVILETLKSNIKDSIDETIGAVKTENVEITVEKIKRLRD